jgi:hypothetical protein
MPVGARQVDGTRAEGGSGVTIGRLRAALEMGLLPALLLFHPAQDWVRGSPKVTGARFVPCPPFCVEWPPHCSCSFRSVCFF